MRSLLERLQEPKEDYVVIFDAPPILGCDDIAALTSVTDLYLLVIGEGETSRRELKTAMSILVDTPVAGVVLNKTTQRFFKRYYY
jgi:Mrp family chromosome partitioning ATPase